MEIAVIRIYRIHLSNLREEQVFTCRVRGDEETVERTSLALWTEWMHKNPGVPTTMTRSGTSARERGVDL